MKTHIVMSQETGEGQFMDLIEQVMGSDRLLSSTDVCKMVDSISKDDVVAVSSLYLKIDTCTDIVFCTYSKI